ncbi:transcriptional regulator, TetR family [Oleidesulfovibrio alaskensis G20]|jgi:AcrR family transcriptional regulator|uniref:Transcriptional regulator, TetR family n=1 Tax=Oleidesulfovibrio alaskensis (strain ATCC BAA-1058 / DSM 17464 / G20) TaxID=207559 RepID=Q30ZU7_OLEA2|nr:TetR/AcrR family transcriptional regulator [Oleidesulfovibrio alaskensis]ABB38799.1 transcriptional regulator, TetR family [Oleidesulfovibrio alaskensis G20]MBG0773103.1 TetR/AcrR family transcriptional regulator [Oleidesulfovibrio alaskensis]MBL3582678.1 TetR/AcrR family transcriptional regulator [Oleidesulfovibrio alaskensis]
MTMTKKDALLLAAKELFGEYGYSETTFKKISERAGVALGLLTHHYGNKEKLFLAAGLDVLDRFIVYLQDACAKGNNGYESVMNFCRAYLDFSIDKNEHFMVLVRCSPYSDMKTKTDRDIMYEKFNQVPRELEYHVRRGIEDGSLKSLPAYETTTVLTCNLVGSIRTKLLTPYAPPSLYDDVLEFISRSIKA